MKETYFLHSVISTMSDITPNKQQRKAIEHPPAPLMILAGAGTGKTFTLEHRIVYLIKYYQVNPANILTITYTEKAARELKERILKKVGKSAHGMTVCTFHSFCYQLLRDYGSDQLPQLLEESEAIHMLLERFDELGPFQSDEFPLNPAKAVIDSFIPFFNRSRDELVNVAEKPTPKTDDETFKPETVAQIDDLKRIFPIFQKWKREMNVVDYGDMILLAYDLLKDNSTVLRNVQAQFQHIIVDEFQDNNFALNEIIGLIAKEHRHITVVGDEDQVIYSFRGANSYNISAFKNRFGGEPITLEENFRSTQPILDIANESIKHNTERTETSLFAKNGSYGLLPKIFWGEKADQLVYLANEISELIDMGNDFHSIAVLCRTHGQANTVAESLLKSGITVQARIPSYFSIPTLLDLNAWCQVVAGGEYQDNALFRLIKNNANEETAHLIFNIWKRRNETPRLQLIKEDDRILTEFPTIVSLIDQIVAFQQVLQKRSAGEMVWKICEKTQLLRKHSTHYSLDDRLAMLNVGDFLKRAQSFSQRNPEDHGLAAFNLYIEAIMVSGGLQTIVPSEYKKLNGIRVSTVHSVKGGEFPIVFLPFQRSGSFPLNFRSNIMISRPPDEWLAYEQSATNTPKDHHYEEERRLFYVAVTRAQEKLYILAPPKATSKFIKELPQNIMEKTVMKDAIKETKSYSDLRIKYEQKIQKALANDQFEHVRDLTSALEAIKQSENGEAVNLGSSDWETDLTLELEQDFEPPVNEKLYLSASAIETFEQCPLKFRFGRIDGIPQTASKPQLLFGTIIHSVLQQFHEPEKELSEERILKLLEIEWKKGEFDYTVREEKFYEQGQEMLARYANSIQNNPPNVIAREERFSFELDDITINGAIDRIDKNENGVQIVDYKTSKTASPAKSNLQLAIYSMFLSQSESEEFGGLPASASLLFLRDEEKPIRAHSFTHEELEKTEEKINDVASGIRKKEFEAKTGRHCDWCDYKHLICPAWEVGE